MVEQAAKLQQNNIVFWMIRKFWTQACTFFEGETIPDTMVFSQRESNTGDHQNLYIFEIFLDLLPLHQHGRNNNLSYQEQKIRY